MATKQGLSAQLSQASEDAKRAVLQRTSLTSSLWFSNLNTTCTIKSAPPRTPEVLSLLASKSGWLFKRNEQHVWQSRWCCVVPHTFLYYFDANVLPGQVQPPVPTSAQQEDWNSAVKDGYGTRSKKHAPRSTLFFSTNYTGTNSNMNNLAEEPEPYDAASGVNGAGAGTNDSSFTSSLQPAGIIDLECYTAVHRSSRNELVMEMAGDDTVNPDLRSFYFCANSEQETEDWTQALLGQRHSALIDETEAYKQVCDGFAQQLQMLHAEMDAAAKQQEDTQEELYQVRSQMEELRRNAWKLVEETLDRSIDENNSNVDGANNNKENAEKKNCVISTARNAYRADLNTAKSQDVGHLTAIQLLTEYTRVLEEACKELSNQNDDLQAELQKANHSDHEQVQTLVNELQQLKEKHQEEKEQWQRDMEASTQRLEKNQKELQDVQKELASTRMEVTMYQSSTRNKLTELQNHKKILKREVIDLRQKLEDANSELTLIQHKQKTGKLEIEQDRKKMELLERYVEKMESQVKVQQNMMEMMSASGVGSVHGGSIHGGFEPYGSFDQQAQPHKFSSVVLVNTPSSVQAEDDELNVNGIGDKEPGRILPRPLPRTVGSPVPGQSSGVGMNSVQSKDTDELAPLMRRSNVDNDVDNKSHMSELTEDRTQKAFDAVFQREYGREYAESQTTPTGASRPLVRLASPRGLSGNGPPSYIGVSGSAAAVDTQQHIMQQFNNNKQFGNSSSGENKLLDTISSPKPAKSIQTHLSQVSNTSSATPTRTGAPSRSEIPRSDKSNRRLEQDNMSASTSASPQRMSVAQRARLEADRHTTPVKIRLNNANGQNSDAPVSSQASSCSNPSPLNRSHQHSSAASVASKASSGFFSAIGKRLEDAIDRTVFAVPDGESEESSLDTTPTGALNKDFSIDSKESPSRVKRHSLLEEKKSPERTERKPLTLQERQQLQRAKQMKFLKDNGIIRDESDVKGGAGASPGFGENTSDASFPEATLSFPGISTESPKRNSIR